MSACGLQASGYFDVDMRKLSEQQVQRVVFAAYEELRVDDALILLNDQEPQGSHEALDQELAGAYIWETLPAVDGNFIALTPYDEIGLHVGTDLDMLILVLDSSTSKDIAVHQDQAIRHDRGVSIGSGHTIVVKGKQITLGGGKNGGWITTPWTERHLKSPGDFIDFRTIPRFTEPHADLS